MYTNKPDVSEELKDIKLRYLTGQISPEQFMREMYALGYDSKDLNNLKETLKEKK